MNDNSKQGWKDETDETPAGTYTDNVVWRTALFQTEVPHESKCEPHDAVKQSLLHAEEGDAEEYDTQQPEQLLSSKGDINMIDDAAEIIEAARLRFPLVFQQQVADAKKATDSSESSDNSASTADDLDNDEVHIFRHGWWAPTEWESLLPDSIGETVPEKPDWFNDVACGEVTSRGKQVGATCGLFAVNHVIAAGSMLGFTYAHVRNKRQFEQVGVAVRHGDALQNLMEPHGSNYDWAILHANLQDAGLYSVPMDPATLQGDTPEDARLEHPFADLIENQMRYRSAGYILRTPQAGGHWIALLHPAALNLEPTDAAAAVLCDSLESKPVIISSSEMSHLLLVIALELNDRQDDDACAAQASSVVFLVTDKGRQIEDTLHHSIDESDLPSARDYIVVE